MIILSCFIGVLGDYWTIQGSINNLHIPKFKIPRGTFLFFETTSQKWLEMSLLMTLYQKNNRYLKYIDFHHSVIHPIRVGISVFKTQVMSDMSQIWCFHGIFHHFRT